MEKHLAWCSLRVYPGTSKQLPAKSSVQKQLTTHQVEFYMGLFSNRSVYKQQDITRHFGLQVFTLIEMKAGPASCMQGTVVNLQTHNQRELQSQQR